VHCAVPSHGHGASLEGDTEPRGARDLPGRRRPQAWQCRTGSGRPPRSKGPLNGEGGTSGRYLAKVPPQGGPS
jgi:hypothetical protein